MVKRLQDFAALSFDCYGTLIDWETGLWASLQPLLDRINPAPSREAALARFAETEAQVQREAPGLRYAAVLAEVHRRLAAAWGAAPDEAAASRFGAGVGDWPAFPDTPEALRRLKQRYRLVILSNVDNASFARTLPRLGVAFDDVFTAEDIGSYKPDPRNFAYLIARLAERGIAREAILHVAQSLFHDHVPANAAGLASAWIDRRAGAQGSGATVPPPQGVRWDFRFESLAALADTCDPSPKPTATTQVRNS
ncbi:MAG TPA: haloacid dehalogenase type II [Acetobacteraceae bacterium]|nr:haloacid dehalogenase type II [Acetobacteraceae bacterium]